MKRHRSVIVALALAAALSLIAQACANETGEPGTAATTAATTTAPSTTTAAPTSTDPMELDKVKVVTLPFITFAPFYIGINQGYFAEQGIEVELVNMAVQEEILPALASGQVDVSSGLVSVGMLNAIARGGNIRITADKGWVDPEGCINWAVIGRGDLVESGELNTPNQLKGRTVNIVPATWLEFYLSEVLATGGLTLDDIERVNVSAQATPDALDQKQIDAAVNSEPWVTRLAAAGHPTIMPLPQELLPGATAAAIVYGPTLLDDNRDLGIRFMTAYLKAVRTFEEGRTDSNLATIAEFTQLDQSLLETMCWPDIRIDIEVDVASIEAFQAWANERGYMDTAVAPADFYDGTFVQEATRRLDG